jgi:DHA1 family multidrug resistance protein-like MFS transporter
MAASDKRFVTFVALSMGYFLLWSQLSLGVSLKAEDLAGTERAVSWVFLTNTLFAIGLQYPVVRWLEPRVKPLSGLILGVSLMGLGLGLIALVSSIWLLLGCVALFATGTLIMLPNQQSLMADLADPKVLGSYMGFSSLGLAVGGASGT